MPRLYYDLETNIKNNKDYLFPPTLDKFIFELESGDILELESNGEDSLKYENGHLNGTWTGDIDYRLFKNDYSEYGDGEFISVADTAETFVKLLDNAKLIGFRFDEDALSEHGYADDFIPACTEACITMETSIINDTGIKIVEQPFTGLNLKDESTLLNERYNSPGLDS